eukprot:Skav233477  [mRNA]  locus=scaffold1310:5924:14162:+ [translate_table: standard]
MFGDDAQHSWPRWGEYDILEAFCLKIKATTTLHTRDSCDQRAVNEGIDFVGQGWAVGTSSNKAKNCWVKAPQQYDNQGCGQKLPQGSFGPAFNRGTFVAEWDPIASWPQVNKRLRTWFFPAGEEPEIGDHPEPDLWGVPNSFFTLNEKCTAAHFKNMRMVFDTTFCGDYAGASFNSFCGWTHMECADYVRSKPNDFRLLDGSCGSHAVDPIALLSVWSFDVVQPSPQIWHWFFLYVHPAVRLGLAFILLVLALGVGLFYFQCSQQKLEALHNVAKSSYKGSQVQLRGRNSAEELFLKDRSEPISPSRASDVEPVPQGRWSWHRVWMMPVPQGPSTHSHFWVAGSQHQGYGDVAPGSPGGVNVKNTSMSDAASNPLPPPAVSRQPSMSQSPPMTNQPSLQARSNH